MSFLDAIVKKLGATGKKYERGYNMPEPTGDIATIKALVLSGDYVRVTSTLINPEDVMNAFNQASVDKHIGCVLLATDTPSVDNGDGTYTHTYMTHKLRYIDPRIAHTQDDRQAKPL